MTPYRAGIPRANEELHACHQDTRQEGAADRPAAKTDATPCSTRDHTEVHKLFKQYEKLADAEADCVRSASAR